MTAAEIEQDRANEQRGIKLMLSCCPTDAAWFFYRLADGTLKVEGVSPERAAGYWTVGRA
jgi:hypothetical protein